jgi:hypothetical protein
MAPPLNRIIVGAVISLLLLGGAGYGWQHRGCFAQVSCTRVLFIGNSYTSVNDLPFAFEQLAESGGQAVGTSVHAPGGYTLQDHVGDSETTARIEGSPAWTFVVLQEQSEIPSIAQSRQSQMFPAALHLIGQIRSRGSTPLLFETWAHRTGWPEAGLADYHTMQAAIDEGYTALSTLGNAEVVPVGEVWDFALGRNPAPHVWQSDGSHPTAEGTYLAACVFYLMIFQRSPVGLGYHGGLPDQTAARDQQLAVGVSTI